MNIKFLTAGILLVATFSSNAYAFTFMGYTYFRTGSIIGETVWSGVPNPDTKPTVLNLTFKLRETEVLCLNPVSYNVAPGTAGARTIYDYSPITPDDIIGENGKVTKVTETEILITSGVKCNKLWKPIYESAAVLAFDLEMLLEFCGNDGDEVCDSTNTEQDRKDLVVKLTCALENPLKRETFSPYAAIEGQPYKCLQTYPLPK